GRVRAPAEDLAELARAGGRDEPRARRGCPDRARARTRRTRRAAPPGAVPGACGTAPMTTATAPAKINLALVVGPTRVDGKHAVATVLQRVDLADTLSVDAGPDLRVAGFEDDTLVAQALLALAEAAGTEPRWHVRIDKRIPVAAGLAGGSSDAAAGLRLANETLPEPLPPDRLSALAATIGADVPFFLAPGTQLGTGDGTELEGLDLPLDYRVVLLLPTGAVKASTAAVYEEFDRRNGSEGF